MDAEQARVTRNQGSRVGRHFVGVEHVREVERGPEVRPIDLPNCEQRGCDVPASGRSDRGSFGKIDVMVDRGIVVGDFANFLDPVIFPSGA